MTLAAAAAPAVLPNPVFEGSEKRIEIDFSRVAASPAEGLRALSRGQLDELMTLAACTIVSSRSNAHLDAYVLSESSLFVYPTKWILKTCGTTKLLHSVPRLLEMAAELGMDATRCKFSRASFLFPQQQLFPHTNFDDESLFLRSLFGHLGNGGAAYVLGDRFNGLQWHVFVADAAGVSYTGRPPTYNLEVCMTELSDTAAAQFFRTPAFVSAERTTADSGIRYLLPAAVIDDYVFEPCGYSMNGIQDAGLMTIHITPEAGFSYASVEISGFADGAFDTAAMIAKILAIFRPGKVAVAMTTDLASKNGYSWGALTTVPATYSCQSASCQELACGGRVSFYNFQYTGVPKAGGYLAPEAGGMRHMPSFSSCCPTDSDVELMSSSGDLTSGGELTSSGELSSGDEQEDHGMWRSASPDMKLPAKHSALRATAGTGV